MATEIYPYKEAEKAIEKSGIKVDSMYSENTEDLKKTQMQALETASAFMGTVKGSKGGKTTLEQNVYRTIQRVTVDAKSKDIDVNANIKNTVYNTVQYQYMDKFKDATTDKEKKETMIKWLPSTAEEQDPFHALNYGKTMTMQAALDKGLGTRYGCQCKMEIISAPDGVEETAEDLGV